MSYRNERMKELLIETGFKKEMEISMLGCDRESTKYREFEYGGIVDVGILNKKMHFIVYIDQFSGDAERHIKPAIKNICKRCKFYYHSNIPYYCHYGVSIPIECYKVTTKIIDEYYRLEDEKTNKSQMKYTVKEDMKDKEFENQLKGVC